MNERPESEAPESATPESAATPPAPSGEAPAQRPERPPRPDRALRQAQDTAAAPDNVERVAREAGEGLPTTPVARARPAKPKGMSRRTFLQMGFWAGLGATVTGMAIGILDLVYPLKTSGFGGSFPAGSVSDYPPGSEPKHFIEGRFWIVRLTPNDGGGEGFLALWHKCPHLGCTVPWRSDFVFQGVKGWFRCPCHGSTYTKAGVRVFGPAPRSMDTMALGIDASGRISVNASKITQGGTDNPDRAAKA